MPLTYIPLARPSPPTILRQLAYQEDHPLVGPDGDPDGWKALELVKIEGFLFKTVRVQATCDVRPQSLAFVDIYAHISFLQTQIRISKPVSTQASSSLYAAIRTHLTIPCSSHIRAAGLFTCCAPYAAITSSFSTSPYPSL